MNRRFFLIGAATTMLPMQATFGAVASCEGRVINAVTASPISSAKVTLGGSATAVMTDTFGRFEFRSNGSLLMVRAPGFLQASTSPPSVTDKTVTIRLTPFHPKALYLTLHGVGDRPIREAVLDLFGGNSPLNAIVIEVKNDQGFLAFKNGAPTILNGKANNSRTNLDLPELLNRLHAKDIYTIARIVTFRDQQLANARPDLAVRTAGGAIYHDHQGLPWVDPFRLEVWNYNVAIAGEAAQMGFDEIQFDYARFPDTPGLVFSQPSTKSSRIAAVSSFLAHAAEHLAVYNVFVAVDVFGYICWNENDTGIGQRLEDIVPLVDYVSPMLYPSGFQFGIPGYRDPVRHPYETVRDSLARALARTHVPPLRFRPWLQAFKDYAFDHRAFGVEEIAMQIRAADNFGSDGWMLWNPRNVYPPLLFSG